MKKDFYLVIVSLTIWGIGEAAFFYFQPLYLDELGASPLGIGAILGIVGLAMSVVHIPAGHLADRIGRRTRSIHHTSTWWPRFARPCGPIE